MLIVIDGYNLIFTVSNLEKYVKVDNIEDARKRLISLLIKYKASKKYNIVLVFDSSQDNYVTPSKQKISGLEIMYAKYGKDADTEIKNIISLSQNPKDTLVVTNDNDIRKFVLKKGSNVIDSVNFYMQIRKSLDSQKKSLPKEYRSKLKGPSKKETKYWLDVFKNEKNKDWKADEEVKIDKSFKKSATDEPFSKFFGPSEDEANYWLKVFDEKHKDDK